MGAILLLIIVLMAIPILALVRGFVLSYLWTWFLVPFGLPEIGVAWAIGLSMIVAYLTHEGAYTGPADEAWGKFAGSLFSPFLLLLFGYIVHSFM